MAGLSFRVSTLAITLVAVLGVGACSQTAQILPASSNTDAAGKPSGPVSAFSQFPDIPVPTGAKIIVDKTLVFGSKPWFGQLTLDASSNANRSFDFFRENLPGYGWEEVTSVRAPTSILTYATEDRVLAIAIRGGTISGSELTITVSPRGKSQSGGSGQGILPPPVIKSQ